MTVDVIDCGVYMIGVAKEGPFRVDDAAGGREVAGTSFGVGDVIPVGHVDSETVWDVADGVAVVAAGVVVDWVATGVVVDAADGINGEGVHGDARVTTGDTVATGSPCVVARGVILTTTTPDVRRVESGDGSVDVTVETGDGARVAVGVAGERVRVVVGAEDGAIVGKVGGSAVGARIRRIVRAGIEGGPVGSAERVIAGVVCLLCSIVMFPAGVWACPYCTTN
jgi:hypothetical protein